MRTVESRRPLRDNRGVSVSALSRGEPPAATATRTHRRRLPCRRHSVLALVCRRWKLLVLEPQLLQGISVNLRRNPLLQLRSFSPWLLRHAAAHVQRLAVRVGEQARPEADAAAYNDGLDQDQECWEGDRAEVVQEVWAVAAACGMMRRLDDLMLDFFFYGDLRLGSWAAVALQHLRRLTLAGTNSTSLIIATPLAPLAALEELDLLSDDVRIQPRASLPPMLTHLQLGSLTTASTLPHQVGPWRFHMHESASLRWGRA